jgi:ABC-type amino acid transport substrate-binding protein
MQPTYSLMRRFAVIFVMLTVPIAAISAENRPTMVRVDFAAYEYPPLYHTSVEGNFSGTLGETIKEMCQEGGLDCRAQMYPIARAYDLVLSGSADMTISGKHPRFDDCCVATEWSYPWSAGLFSALPESEVPKTESEMLGRSLIVVRGWRSPYRFMPNFDQLVADKKITVYYPDSNFGAIQMLNNGRADLLWGSIDFLWYLEKLNLSGKFEYTELLKIPIVLWVDKTKQDVVEGLNSGFDNLQSKELLDDQNLLLPHLMEEVFQDAPVKETQ